MSSGNTPGAFVPFGHRAFALLWTATLISNIGTWMHDVGAGWSMTTLNSNPAVVTLVQAATTLPVFLFALFAGALADRLDKRRMLIVINLVLFAVISVLTVLVWQERMTPPLLILFTLAIGTGAAFMAPAWQAVVPQLVPRDTLKPTIALNSMGINISRAIRPALAGVLIAGVGLAAPFALNAASHLVIIAALIFWRPNPSPGRSRHGSIASEMATGLRHVRHNGPMLATLVRALAFFLFASVYWSLLPLIALGAEGGSELCGSLMALIGAGAVTGALGTVTYLYQGEFEHRDRLGTHQMIYPGEVNWMIAGRGVTHSERTSPETRATRHKLFGIQTGIALPEDREDMAPDFEHHKEAVLPMIVDTGTRARLISGNAYGEKSPVTMQSETFYLDAMLQPGAKFPLPDDHEDRGVYITEGSVEIAGDVFDAGRMMVFRPGDRIGVCAGNQGARLMALGGATMSQARYIWWNYLPGPQLRLLGKFSSRKSSTIRTGLASPTLAGQIA